MGVKQTSKDACLGFRWLWSATQVTRFRRLAVLFWFQLFLAMPKVLRRILLFCDIMLMESTSQQLRIQNSGQQETNAQAPDVPAETPATEVATQRLGNCNALLCSHIGDVWSVLFHYCVSNLFKNCLWFVPNEFTQPLVCAEVNSSRLHAQHNSLNQTEWLKKNDECHKLQTGRGVTFAWMKEETP